MLSPVVRTIAWREVRDTLTDWRILLPIFILTFVLPQLILVALVTALQYIGSQGTVGRLVPFAMLLVGFVPASFSLIAALEAFVGERERNSLEALLAMPLSDGELYLGKLLSSLLPPLLSSYLGMTIFGVSLSLARPDLFLSAFTPARLALVFALIGVKALVMVTGAVIISSHTTSIRAANLLASFVLIPTASLLQLEALLIIANRWDVLGLVALGLLTVALMLGRTGVQGFNREEILSREHEQFNLTTIRRRFATVFREYRPAGVPLDAYAGLPFSPRRFYRHELPALLRECRLPLGVALAAALLGLGAGSWLSFEGYGHALLTDALQQAIGRPPAPGVALAAEIFVRNIRVALLSSVLSALAFGIFAFLVPAVAFAQVGYVATWLVADGGDPWRFILGYVVPHGIVELPTAIIGAALGLRVGAALMSPPPGFTVGENLLWALANFLKTYLLLLVPLFLLAALIEGLLTPLVIRALY
jgi:uncharacterized membrane protein SpoIIM required for sporulation/ABC-type transport system involved in multi-copper enzyme maturation permease subunit